MNKKDIGDKKVFAVHTETEDVSVWIAGEVIFRMYKYFCGDTLPPV